KPLISLYDQAIGGHQTFLLGVPGIKPDASIGISTQPLMLHSNDTFPMRAGKQPHQGPDARAIHQKAYDDHGDQFEWKISKAWWVKLKEMGSTRDDFPQVLDGMNRNPDLLITMGVPEFEFPRPGLELNLRYLGAFKKPQKKSGVIPDLPSWWDDLPKAKAAGKKIVVVSQGTVETNPNDLILPTLEALKDRDDVLVIGTFYISEPEEVPGLVVPNNARVARYIPHDDLLPFVDVMVGNGGFGGVQKTLMSGIPMVISGVAQDKAVVGAIADFTGVGINLGMQAPGAERIGEAVKKILEDPSYGLKAKELSKAFDRYDMQKVLDNAVQDVVRDWQKQRKRATREL
ncbi:glycosyltransferase family 1 protein, partial [Karstenula rhodostoma CBS 690.94]